MDWRTCLPSLLTARVPSGIRTNCDLHQVELTRAEPAGGFGEPIVQAFLGLAAARGPHLQRFPARIDGHPDWPLEGQVRDQRRVQVQNRDSGRLASVQ